MGQGPDKFLWASVEPALTLPRVRHKYWTVFPAALGVTLRLLGRELTIEKALLKLEPARDLDVSRSIHMHLFHNFLTKSAPR